MNRLHHHTELERRKLESILAQELAADSRINFAYLFGSFLEERPFHDVDVAVHLNVDDPAQRLDDSLTLAGALSRRLNVPVEVHVLNDAPTPFAFHAMHGRLLTCRDENLLTLVLETTMRRYFDAEPLRRRCFKEIYEP